MLTTRFRRAVQLGLTALALASLASLAAAPRAEWAPGDGAIDISTMDFEIQVHPLELARGDIADVYWPVVPPHLRPALEDAFPLVVVLQGALIDKLQYGTFARALAEQGFFVIVPNHFQTLPGMSEPALFTDVNVLKDAIDQMRLQDTTPGTPAHFIVDPERTGFVGHSLGGAVGLYASAGLCVPTICDTTIGFERPEALKAGVVYGASLYDTTGSGELVDLDTSGVAIAMLQGTEDGVSTPAEALDSEPLLEPSRALIQIEGANHYAICEHNNPLGALAIEPGVVTPEAQQAGIRRVAHWAGVWLREYLGADASSEP